MAENIILDEVYEFSRPSYSKNQRLSLPISNHTGEEINDLEFTFHPANGDFIRPLYFSNCPKKLKEYKSCYFSLVFSTFSPGIIEGIINTTYTDNTDYTDKTESTLLRVEVVYSHFPSFK